MHFENENLIMALEAENVKRIFLKKIGARVGKGLAAQWDGNDVHFFVLMIFPIIVIYLAYSMLVDRLPVGEKLQFDKEN